MPGFSLSPQADGDRNGVMAPAGTSYGSSPKDSNVSPISQSLSGRKDKKRDLSILIPEGQALKGDVLRVANRSASGDDAQNHATSNTPSSEVSTPAFRRHTLRLALPNLVVSPPPPPPPQQTSLHAYSCPLEANDQGLRSCCTSHTAAWARGLAAQKGRSLASFLSNSTLDPLDSRAPYGVILSLGRLRARAGKSDKGVEGMPLPSPCEYGSAMNDCLTTPGSGGLPDSGELLDLHLAAASAPSRRHLAFDIPVKRPPQHSASSECLPRRSAVSLASTSALRLRADVHLSALPSTLGLTFGAKRFDPDVASI
eukprot:1191796-Prorocentrum_minimum.AAC.4